jgi:hypothetical protein
VRNLNSFSYRERVLNGDIAFAENAKNLHASFESMAHLAGGLHIYYIPSYTDHTESIKLSYLP